MPDGTEAKLSVEDFARRVRDRYPEAYDYVPDGELTERVIRKYPVYAEQVDLAPPTISQPFSSRSLTATPVEDRRLNTTPSPAPAQPSTFPTHVPRVPINAPASAPPISTFIGQPRPPQAAELQYTSLFDREQRPAVPPTNKRQAMPLVSSSALPTPASSRQTPVPKYTDADFTKGANENGFPKTEISKAAFEAKRTNDAFLDQAMIKPAKTTIANSTNAGQAAQNPSQITEADYKQYVDYQKSIGRQAVSFDDFKRKAAKPGKVFVKARIKAPEQPQGTVEVIPAKYIPQSWKLGDRQPTDEDLQRGDFVYLANAGDLKGKAKSDYILKSARKSLVQNLGVTDEQAVQIVGRLVKEVSDVDPSIVYVHVPKSHVAQVMGPDFLKQQFRKETLPVDMALAMQDQPGADQRYKLNPQVRPDFTETVNDWYLKDVLGMTPEQWDQWRKPIPLTPEQEREYRSEGQLYGDLGLLGPAGEIGVVSPGVDRMLGMAYGGLLNSLATSGDWVAGINYLRPSQIAGAVAWKLGLIDKLPEHIDFFGQQRQGWKLVNEEAKKPYGVGGEAISLLGGLPTDFLRMGLQSTLGGPEIGLALDQAVTSAGRGDKPVTVAANAGWGFLDGLTLKGAGVVSSLVKRGILNTGEFTAEEIANIISGKASLPLRARATLAIYGRGASLATLAGGVYTTSKLQGDSDEDIRKKIAMFAFFDTMTALHANVQNYAGKIFKIKANREVKPITIDEQGDVVELKKTPKAADITIDAEEYIRRNKEQIRVLKEAVAPQGTRMDSFESTRPASDVSTSKANGIQQPLIQQSSGEKAVTSKADELKATVQPKSEIEVPSSEELSDDAKREQEYIRNAPIPLQIEEPDPASVRLASIDTRARGVTDFLKQQDGFVTTDEIAKATRMNSSNIGDTVSMLYDAGILERLPDNRVRLINQKEAAAPVKGRVEAATESSPTRTPQRVENNVEPDYGPVGKILEEQDKEQGFEFREGQWRTIRSGPRPFDSMIAEYRNRGSHEFADDLQYGAENAPEEARTPNVKLDKKSEGKLDALRAEYQRFLPTWLGSLDRLRQAAGLSSEALINPDEIKGKARAAEKFESIRKKRGIADPRRALRHIVRATFIIDSPEEAQKLRDQITRNFRVVFENNRFTKPLPNEYSDVLLEVDLGDGLYGEIQITVPEMYDAKKISHLYYKRQRTLRDLKRLTSEQKLEMRRMAEIEKRLHLSAKREFTRRKNSSLDTIWPIP